jgi:hypothetical protein
VVGLASERVPQMRRFAQRPHLGDIVGLNQIHSQKANFVFFARLRLVSEATVAHPKHSCAALLHLHCPRQASEAVEEVCLCLYSASREEFHYLGAAWEAAVAAQDHRWPVGAAAVGLAHQGRLSCKGLLEVAEEVGNICSIPHATPISQVWMVHSSFHAHVLPRPYQHVPSWCHIDNRRLLRICLGDP